MCRIQMNNYTKKKNKKLKHQIISMEFNIPE